MKGIPYTKYSYLYPPRPEHAVPIEHIGTYEEMGYVAQPKLDGSSCLVFTDGTNAIAMSRHATPFAAEPMLLKDGTFRKLHRGTPGKWTVLVGELMNKSKRDERGRAFSGYVVHDVLVADGVHLVGTTFAERIALLDSMYGTAGSDQPELHATGHERVYRVRTYRGPGLAEFFRGVTAGAQMYEGIVAKDPAGRLEHGMRQKNTRSGQVKVRRTEKNYAY